MEKVNLKVEYINVNELIPYTKNAKLHPAQQIEQIKKSIIEFGMNDPIAIDKNNIIVEGHGRLIACKELGMTEVPIIRLDHLSDEERKAYTLAHNKLTMNSDFDIDVLDSELDDILNIDMSDFGFETNIDDSFEEKELDDKREKQNVSVNIVLQSYTDYEIIKERIENLTDEVNGNLSIKMI